MEIKESKSHFLTLTSEGKAYRIKHHQLVRCPESDLVTEERYDPDTEINSLAREDNFHIFNYKNGTKVINFPDSTIMTISPT